MEVFFTGFLLSLSLDLGIVNLAILKTGFENGFRASLWVGIGSSLGDILYALLTVVGISYLYLAVYIFYQGLETFGNPFIGK